MLNNACDEDEPESVGWDQALQWGKKGKKRGKIGKISASEASLWYPFPSPDYVSARFARRFLFYAHTDFFSFFPTMRSLVPGYKVR